MEPGQYLLLATNTGCIMGTYICDEEGVAET